MTPIVPYQQARTQSQTQPLPLGPNALDGVLQICREGLAHQSTTGKHAALARIFVATMDAQERVDEILTRMRKYNETIAVLTDADSGTPRKSYLKIENGIIIEVECEPLEPEDADLRVSEKELPQGPLTFEQLTTKSFGIASDETSGDKAEACQETAVYSLKPTPALLLHADDDNQGAVEGILTPGNTHSLRNIGHPQRDISKPNRAQKRQRAISDNAEKPFRHTFSVQCYKSSRVATTSDSHDPPLPYISVPKSSASVVGGEGDERGRSPFQTHSPVSVKISHDFLPVRPKRLLSSRESKVTYCSAILQAFSSTLDASSVSHELRDNTNVNEHQAKAKQILFGLIQEMQNDSDWLIDHGDFEESFAKLLHGNKRLDGTQEQDAGEYLEQIFNRLSCPALEETYKIDKLFRSRCSNRDCQTGEIEYSSFEEDWVLPLNKPDPIHRGLRAFGMANRVSLSQLLGEKYYRKLNLICDYCGRPGTCSSWSGLTAAPKTLIIKFDRDNGGNDGYMVELPQTYTFDGYLPKDCKRRSYALVSTIKHTGPSLDRGFYTTYIRMADGRWWRCVNEVVRETAMEAVNSRENGNVYLAFYKLEA